MTIEDKLIIIARTKYYNFDSLPQIIKENILDDIISWMKVFSANKELFK